MLMLMRAFSPFDTQRSYRVRKSAVDVAVLTVVAAGGCGLDGVPFRTSAQEGELETGTYCMASCCRIGGDPAGKVAPTTLPASGGAEPREARLGLAGRTAVSTCPAGPLSYPKEGEMRWQGVATNSDRPEGSALLPPSPPWWGGGGRGTWLQGGQVEPTPWLRGRGLLTTRVSQLTTRVSGLTTRVSQEILIGLYHETKTATRRKLGKL